ncbi:3360_t:CDS:2, partial [Entrophospora sp. SA101]
MKLEKEFGVELENEDVDTKALNCVKKIKYSASEFALQRNWIQELDHPNPPFLNCRPPNNYDIPITLYNEVFGKFLRDCKDLVITNEDKNIVCELLSKMSGAFMSHNERINAFQEYFEELHDKNSYILQQTCIPTFLVYIYGPYFGIAGAVMGQKVTIDPLVEGSLILKHGNRFWIDQISRVFCALRKANNHLDEYYSQIPKFQKEKTELKARILHSVKIMHDNDFVHGDLCFDNIMAKLDSNGKWVI